MLSVVIPVFNEEATLRETITAVDRHLAEQAIDGYEIIVSDDGSSDSSASIVETLAAKLPVRLLRDEVNRGKGAAVRRGVLAAGGDPILFFDADLSTPLTEMDRFLEALEGGADLAIGTRRQRGARIEQDQPRRRVVLGSGYRWLVRSLLSIPETDITCGFKAFRANAARELFSRGQIDGWSFDAELLFLARRSRLRIVEIPVRWVNRPDSRVRLGTAIVSSLADLLRIRRNARRGLYR